MADKRIIIYIDAIPDSLDNDLFYYRLEIRSASNAPSFSKIAILKKEPEKSGILLWPNVAQGGSVSLYLNAWQQTTVQVALVDIGGRVWIRRTLNVQKGDNRTGIDISVLDNGIYYLRVTGTGFNETLRLVKL